MEAYRHNRMTIELHNDEIDTMRALAALLTILLAIAKVTGAEGVRVD